VELGQLVKIIQSTKCADFISKGSYIIKEDDGTTASQMKWGEELVCHERLKCGNPK
jgi:hypothetical protein